MSHIVSRCRLLASLLSTRAATFYHSARTHLLYSIRHRSQVLHFFYGLFAMCLCGTMVSQAQAAADGLPQGAAVQAGDISMHSPNDTTLQINQASHKAIINWNSFSIAEGHLVAFAQPSSSAIALNRVVGGSMSEIFGSLTANGVVWLLNPSGIIFGPNSRIDTAGFLASTLDIADGDFLSDRFVFTRRANTTSYLVQQGEIVVRDGGSVFLLGGAVRNEGSIRARLGNVVLASGDKITLELDSEGMMSVVLDEPTSQALTTSAGEDVTDAVANIGTITADGGTVLLTAHVLKDVFQQAVNNEGVIQARSLVERNGTVFLLSEGDGALTAHTGTIDTGPVEDGAGTGFVEISGERVFIDGQVIGDLLIDPVDVLLGVDITEAFLEGRDGITFVQADHDVTFAIPDGELNLQLLDRDGEGFSVLAGHSIFFNNDGVTTQGGSLEFLADFGAFADGDGDVHLGTGLGLTTNGGHVTIAGENVFVTAPIVTSGGHVLIGAATDVVHSGDGDVLTGGGHFIGYAGRDYILRNGARVVTGAGVIDIYGERHVILGYAAGEDPFPSPNTMTADFDLTGQNVFVAGNQATDSLQIFVDEAGEYVVLVEAGYSGSSQPNEEYAMQVNAGPIGSVIGDQYNGPNTSHDYRVVVDHGPQVLDQGFNTLTFYKGQQPAGGGIGSVHFRSIQIGRTDTPPGVELSSTENVFLTAKEGFIKQAGGTIKANKLMLAANQGISGTGPDGSLQTEVNHVSATNDTSGHIKLSNTGDLIIDDLTGEVGFNPDHVKPLYYFKQSESLHVNAGTPMDSTMIDVPEAGDYRLFVDARYGGSGQTNETYQLQVNGGAIGAVTPDPFDGLQVPYRFRTDHGVFSLTAGANEVKFHGSGDSVHFERIRLVKVANPPITGSNGILNAAPGGMVNVQVASNLLVHAPIEAYGAVALAASENIWHNEDGDVLIHQIGPPLPDPDIDVTSPSHSLSTWSNDNTVDVEWMVTELFDLGGTYTGTAGGTYTMDPGSMIETYGGDATVSAQGDVALALIDAGRGDVEVSSATGSIIDNDLGVVDGPGPFPLQDDVDIIAHKISMSAPLGSIGGVGPGEQIDVDFPYDFSYLWDELPGTEPDLIEDPYTALLNGSGDWVFATTSPPLADSPDWHFHLATFGSWGAQYATQHLGPFFIDTTPPVVTASVPPPNANGWYNVDVTVDFSATDNLSGFAPGGALSAPDYDSQTTTGEGLGLVVTSAGIADRAGNLAVPLDVILNIDKTAPTIIPTRDPLPNANGWNNTDVTVSYAVGDALSGVDGANPLNDFGDDVFVNEGAGQVANGIVYDLAGNFATAQVTDINIDKTAPTIIPTRDPLPNANGWNNTDVTVSYAVGDALSGVDGANPLNDFGDDVFVNEGAGQVANGIVYDLAGNFATAQVTDINIDKTPPDIDITLTPGPGPDGLNVPPVNVAYDPSDTLSGIDFANPLNELGDDLFTDVGLGQTAVATAFDKAGNSTTVVIDTINIVSGDDLISGLFSDELRFKIPTLPVTENFQISFTQGPIELVAGQVFFYHPLVEMEMYEVPIIGIDAYEFIENSIRATNPALLPVFE